MIEVKIKQGNEMLDATIEMVDGVMVVSPKEVKFEPKDGDVMASPNSMEFFFFEKDFDGSFANCYGGLCLRTNVIFTRGRWHVNRLATEEEKKKLFDKLAEEGLEWDAERKELVKLKWNPKIGETYYRPNFLHCQFVCYSGTADYNKIIYVKDYINKGWIFRTKEECQEFCNRLNDAINSVKP